MAIRPHLDHPPTHGRITLARSLGSSSCAQPLLMPRWALPVPRGFSPSRYALHEDYHPVLATRVTASGQETRSPLAFRNLVNLTILKHFLLPCINHQIECYYPKNTDPWFKCIPSFPRSPTPTARAGVHHVWEMASTVPPLRSSRSGEEADVTANSRCAGQCDKEDTTGAVYTGGGTLTLPGATEEDARQDETPELSREG